MNQTNPYTQALKYLLTPAHAIIPTQKYIHTETHTIILYTRFRYFFI